ncbi:MAG TPA: hypothetical protein VFI76_05115 [Terrimicrobiaceae bacterium]|nr:hypothetical protein [Terrimicrobiaceae bacterium]
MAQTLVTAQSGIPGRITRGDSCTFDLGGPYTDADGMTAWWKAEGGTIIAGTYQTGTLWRFTLGPGHTAAFEEGPLDWVQWFEQSGNRMVYCRGTVTIAPDPIDGRALSFNERLLAKLEEYLEGRNEENKDPFATSFSIDGASYSFESATAAWDLLTRVKRVVAQEKDRRRIAAGYRSKTTIHTTFGSPRRHAYNRLAIP